MTQTQTQTLTDLTGNKELFSDKKLLDEKLVFWKVEALQKVLGAKK